MSRPAQLAPQDSPVVAMKDLRNLNTTTPVAQIATRLDTDLTAFMNEHSSDAVEGVIRKEEIQTDDSSLILSPSWTMQVGRPRHDSAQLFAHHRASQSESVDVRSILDDISKPVSDIEAARALLSSAPTLDEVRDHLSYDTFDFFTDDDLSLEGTNSMTSRFSNGSKRTQWTRQSEGDDSKFSTGSRVSYGSRQLITRTNVALLLRLKNNKRSPKTVPLVDAPPTTIHVGGFPTCASKSEDVTVEELDNYYASTPNEADVARERPPSKFDGADEASPSLGIQTDDRLASIILAESCDGKDTAVFATTSPDLITGSDDVSHGSEDRPDSGKQLSEFSNEEPVHHDTQEDMSEVYNIMISGKEVAHPATKVSGRLDPDSLQRRGKSPLSIIKETDSATSLTANLRGSVTSASPTNLNTHRTPRGDERFTVKPDVLRPISRMSRTSDTETSVKSQLPGELHKRLDGAFQPQSESMLPAPARSRVPRVVSCDGIPGDRCFTGGAFRSTENDLQSFRADQSGARLRSNTTMAVLSRTKRSTSAASLQIQQQIKSRSTTRALGVKEEMRRQISHDSLRTGIKPRSTTRALGVKEEMRRQISHDSLRTGFRGVTVQDYQRGSRDSAGLNGGAPGAIDYFGMKAGVTQSTRRGHLRNSPSQISRPAQRPRQTDSVAYNQAMEALSPRLVGSGRQRDLNNYPTSPISQGSDWRMQNGFAQSKDTPRTPMNVATEISGVSSHLLRPRQSSPNPATKDEASLLQYYSREARRQGEMLRQLELKRTQMQPLLGEVMLRSSSTLASKDGVGRLGDDVSKSSAPNVTAIPSDVVLDPTFKSRSVSPYTERDDHKIDLGMVARLI